MISHNSISVDDFVGGPPSPSSALKVWFLNRLQVGSRQPKKMPDGSGGYKLKVSESDKLPGLKVTCRDENGDGVSDASGKPPVIVGTIRMGFGHHRIAYATASWGLNKSDERETWFHDFLNIDSEEAQMIKDTDKLYSKGSRLASEVNICQMLSIFIRDIPLLLICSHLNARNPSWEVPSKSFGDPSPNRATKTPSAPHTNSPNT